MFPIHLTIRNGTATLNGAVVAATGSPDPAEMYRLLRLSYPKFFKMDLLCKWAWLGAEIILSNGHGSWRYEGADRSKIAVVLATADGSLDVDLRFNESRATIASPALFVYTLANIMLGEICIRHAITGEQLCEARDAFDAEELHWWVSDLLQHRETTHCLYGWANAVGSDHDICLFWSDAEDIKDITPAMLESIYNSA